MRINHRLLICLSLTVLGSSALLYACNGLRYECGDGIDNDGDGFIDGNDPACQSAAARTNARNTNCGQATSGLPVDNPACSTGTAGVQEFQDPPCFDRVDNDGDGFTDYPDDVGCTSRTDLDEENTECADGIDNDGDGLTDWHQDPGCGANPRNATEAADPICSDRRDNDGDGKTDYPADPGCSSSTDTSEIDPECSDGVDNDGDGNVDFPNDVDCTSATSNREAAFQCNDGVDNDFDGVSDYPADIGCTSIFDDEEANPDCSDGRDNDGDGRIDYPEDPGCASAYDESESQPACSDGLDNDLDGRTDFPEDPACDSPEDTNESSQCSDGVDNDGDGLVDYPADPSCTTPQDISENSQDICFDGLDNDGDGFTDFPQDPGCTSATDTTESDASGDCSDGIDNDNDGFIDSTTPDNLNPGDPACNLGFIWEHLDPTCDDRADNDGDGRADFLGVDLNYDGRFDAPGEFPPDPGCSAAGGHSEFAKPQCADGVDNDGDGSADWAGIDLDNDGRYDGNGEMPPDYACILGEPTPIAGQRRRDESSPAQCNDGVDNDGDGFIDFEPEFLDTDPPSPNPDVLLGDPNCTSAFDNQEAN